MHYYVKKFAELSVEEFYQLVKLRVSVFIVEQNCPYQEIDDYDEKAVHTWLQEGTDIVGYTRIIDLGETITFGRVLINPKYRGKKLGDRLLEKTLKVIASYKVDKPIVIGAQAHLTKFYGGHGFVPISDIYLEDDIPHVKMRRENELNFERV